MTKFVKYALVALIGVIFSSTAQSQNLKTEKKKVIAVIKQMFDGMRKGDADMVANTFYEKTVFQTTFTHRKTKKAVIHEGSAEKFVTSIRNKKPSDLYDERISEYIVKLDDNLANVWTPYEFYLNSKFSHCGVNNFQLFKSDKGWKIISIADTRRRNGCKK